MSMQLTARELVGGTARGELLYAETGLSFWGGVDPLNGAVIDHTHPLHRKTVTGKVLAIPNGRGSCTGSQVMLELLLGDIAPAAILLRQPDVILALGVIVAEELFGKSIPLLSLGPEGFAAIADMEYVTVSGTSVEAATHEALLSEPAEADCIAPSTPDMLLAASSLVLSSEEQDMLDGGRGKATQALQRAGRGKGG